MEGSRLRKTSQKLDVGSANARPKERTKDQARKGGARGRSAVGR